MYKRPQMGRRLNGALQRHWYATPLFGMSQFWNRSIRSFAERHSQCQYLKGIARNKREMLQNSANYKYNTSTLDRIKSWKSFWDFLVLFMRSVRIDWSRYMSRMDGKHKIKRYEDIPINKRIRNTKKNGTRKHCDIFYGTFISYIYSGSNYYYLANVSKL